MSQKTCGMAYLYIKVDTMRKNEELNCLAFGYCKDNLINPLTTSHSRMKVSTPVSTQSFEATIYAIVDVVLY